MNDDKTREEVISEAIQEATGWEELGKCMGEWIKHRIDERRGRTMADLIKEDIREEIKKRGRPKPCSECGGEAEDAYWSESIGAWCCGICYTEVGQEEADE